MPNARKKGLKLVGAFVPDEVDDHLVKAAKQRGFKDKAAFLRYLYDEALKAEPPPKKKRKPAARSKRGTKEK